MGNQDEHNWGVVPRALMFFLIFAATVVAQDTQAPQPRAELEATNSSNNTTNASNNPVTLKTQIILHNYFMPSVDGYNGRAADQELVRLYLPVKLFGVQTIFRVYQPIETNPRFRMAGTRDLATQRCTIWLFIMCVSSPSVRDRCSFCRWRATRIWAVGNGRRG